MDISHLNQYISILVDLLSAYCVPGIVLGSEDLAVTEKKKINPLLNGP